MSDDKKEKLTEEEIKKILELLAEAMEQADRKLTSAVLVTDINEDGSFEGKELLNDNDDDDTISLEDFLDLDPTNKTLH